MCRYLRPWPAPITQAFNQLIRHFLAEPEAKYEKIKKEIIEALGDVAQVIIDIVPDLERMLGKQPTLQQLPPQETQNRMKYFFGKFIQVVASKDHPLVIFIDDLQWADSGSLLLLNDILTNDSLKHILLIGAYRDNEVDTHHPLSLFFKTIQDQNKIIETLLLHPLTVRDFEALFRDSFHRDEAAIRPLAELVHRRTQGNPFFCKQVINKLYQENLLYFNFEVRQWEWKFQEIESLKITDNVVDLLLSKLSELREETRKILKLAACIGNRFKLETLALISGESPEQLGKLLWPALQMELLFTQRLGYKRVVALRDEAMSQVLLRSITYQFVHDRIQQAVYQDISPKERQTTHLSIARLMIEKEAKACEKEKLFEVTDHFNEAHALLDASEIDLVRKLNYQAGMQALAANAYRPMFNYLKVSLSLCDESGWKNYYELMFKINFSYAQSLYLTGGTDEGIRLTDELLNRAQTKIDKAAIYRVRCLHFCRIDNAEDMAIQSALKALELLGVKIPRYPSTLQILWKMFQINRSLNRYKNINTLFEELKTATDPDILFAFQVITDMTYSVYNIPGKMVAYLPLVAMQLMLRYGRFGGSSQQIMNYAVVNFSITGNLSRSKDLWEIAQRYMLQEKEKYSHVYTYMAYAYVIGTMLEPFKALRGYVTHAIQCALESGNFASIPRTLGMEAGFIREEARSLKEYEAQTHEALKFAEKNNLLVMGNAENLTLLIAKVLQGAAVNEDEMKQCFQKILEGKSKATIAIMSGALTWCNFYLEAYAEASQYFFSSENERKAMPKTMIGAFYTKTLGGLCLYKTRTHLDKFPKIIKELKWAATVYPNNYEHEYLILCGAKADMDGKYHEATGFFEQAASKAKKGDFYLWAALANELAGDLLMREQHPQAARTYVQEAHYYYGRYGLIPKVKSLEKRYPQCFVERADGSRAYLAHSGPASLPSGTISTSVSFDIMSIMKASQAISGEIILTKLCEKILHIVMENAGAEKALFLEQDKKSWMVTAKLAMENNEEKYVMLNEPLNHVENIPKTIIQFSIRSGETVVLSNASESNQYKNDPYILQAQPKSILCLPVIYKDKVHSIIYLENNLTIGAFTQDRVTVLTTLASQIAISLENARLYYHATHDNLTGLANRNLLYQVFEEVTRIAEKFLQKLKEPVNFDGHDLILSSSIGISLYPRDGETIAELLKQADIALYRVKVKGKNQFQLYTA